MAEIGYNKTTTADGDLLVSWLSVTESDTFEAFDLGGVEGELSLQIGGTFGGATVTIKGQIAGGYVDMAQMDGTTASATSADIFSLLDRPLHIQPSASGGSSQSVNVYMLVRK